MAQHGDLIAETPFDSHAPWTVPWPDSELETVVQCPVCGAGIRELLLDELVDNVFFVANGKWTLHRCLNCRSAYLDPRPTRSSIGRAYGFYYTHGGGGRRNDDELSRLERIKRLLANGYSNWRYGTRRKPASALGLMAAFALPHQRRQIDVAFRFLPKPQRGWRLLDIGCGNGNFLLNARDAGWEVCGIEPDAVAADLARRQKLDVRIGTFEDQTADESVYNAITLSHVIEHVHEPNSLIRFVNRVLKPGGVVYIETPNVDSHGFAHFGRFWRGIEAPRHLVLFNPSSLGRMLSAAGFDRVVKIRRPSVRKSIYSRSASIAASHNANGVETKKAGVLDALASALSYVETDRLEFVTIMARKPGP